MNIEKAIFYVLIFSIPFQTRLVLRSWGLKPDGLAHIGIGFNEWNAAFLYFTDLLIIALLLLWFLRQFHFYDISQKWDSHKKSIFSKYDWFLIGFLVISAISIKNAINPALGFYQLIKLLEFSLLYFYVKSNFNAVFNLATAFFVFLASGIFQAILSIFQYIRQSDLGLRFLGETVLNPDLFNVATFLVNGEKIMRSYGTTPHPNVLAFILFISVFILYFGFTCDRKFIRNIQNYIGLSIYGILLFGFFFTFSRIIIFVWLVGFILLIKKLSKRIIITTLAIVVLFSVLFWPEVLARLYVSPQEEAVSLRNFYNQIAFQEKPFFGVGLGNFVNWLKEENPGLAPNFYQPVHNIYLLIFSETGVLGLTAFLLFYFFLIKNYLSFKLNRLFYHNDISLYHRNLLFAVFISLLFFGLFDHFLLTLQQGSILFWLIAGLLAAFSPHSSIG